MVAYRSRRDGQWITLTQELAHSGEAKVWRVDRPGFLAKIYHHPDPQRCRKLELMALYRPSDPNARQGHISFAWPDSILETDGGEGIGFLMPEAENSLDLLKISTPKYREDAGIKLDWYFLHVVARNIAGIIQAIHHEGYVLGDIKLQNILVNNKALPTIINTDSFQVSDPYTSQIYRCLVATEEFTPPELLGLEMGKVDQTEVHDRFRLGVVIHHLLFGQGPFQGRWQGSGEEPETVEWIQRGLWPYGPSGLVVPGRLTIPLEIVHPRLQVCFLRCFNEGHPHPNQRPTAQDWWEAFDDCLGQIDFCNKVDSHRYSAAYGRCYWCERANDLGVDIFPAQSSVTRPISVPPPPKSVSPPPRRRFLKTLGLVGAGGALVWATQKVLPLQIFAGLKPKPSPTPEPSPTPTLAPEPSPTLAGNYTETLPGGVQLSMIAIPAGRFLMGSPDSDSDAHDDEKPQHEVSLGAFHIGQFPITEEQWQAIMGKTFPYYEDFRVNPQNPVMRVFWDDCQAFCQKLSQLAGKTYRLPSEAEWEYACRAGTTTRYSFGDDAEQLGDYGWYADYSDGNYDGNSGVTTHPVGQKKPNSWGLFDVHGNVWEWCADHWHESYAGKPQSLKDNGNTIWVSSNDSEQVIRGGSWRDAPGVCRSASRLSYPPNGGSNFLGFRVLCEGFRLS
ncbi:MAG: SUMF1/EgtB/PvdO family nonheme iron enzyme [Cyanobacteriota bacterium]|jgi:formylglycine-generating enzyme required for sulfatase activity